LTWCGENDIGALFPGRIKKGRNPLGLQPLYLIGGMQGLELNSFFIDIVEKEQFGINKIPTKIPSRNLSCL
jgi:hypothetical protein